MSLRTLVVGLVLFAGVPACVDSPDDKGAEAEVPGDGKLDSFARPTDHGPVAFSTMVEATLTAAQRYHTWTFELSGDASVHAYTGPSLTSRRVVDTVLYLYRQRPDGTWGAYLYRNDDADGSLFSSLTRSLTAGRYRILVKGYAASTRGQFAAAVECAGAGCGPAAPACLFGATFGDLLAGTGYAITADRELHVTDYLSELDQARVVVAVQQSAHTDVMTAAEAFAAVDQQVIRRVDLYDADGARAFVAFEYGAGDNSYGAVFGYGSTAIAARIHDGDLEACTAAAQTCALGPDWSTTRTSGAFTIVASTVVTAAGQLSGVDAADALAAIQVAYADAATLADGLARVDGGGLNVVDLRAATGGTVVRAFEYGAGDSSYGAIFRAGTAERVASIVDLTYYDCALTQ